MIVPGSVNPLLFAGDGDPLDEYLKIARSVRFNPPDSPSFSRTTGAAGGDRDKWWVFVAFKRTAIDTVQYLHGADTAAADAIYINTANKLCIDIAGTTRLVSTRVFRDLSAHGMLLVCFDAANVTASSRLRVYYASTASPEIMAWDTDTRSGIAAGTAKTMHNSIAHVIGKSPTAASGFWDGLISEHRIGTWSGTPPTLTDHCAIHSKTGQWRPKTFSGSYGAHGSRIDFADGSAATAGALGADRSGNGNNWTPANISVAAGHDCDWLTDTPTRNTCVLSALKSNLVPTNGGLTISGSGHAHGTMLVPKDIPVYWETKTIGGTSAGCGFGLGVTRTGIDINTAHTGGGVGVVGYYASATANLLADSGGVTVIGGGLPAANDIMQVAIAWPKMWVGRNDVWLDAAGGTTGNPATGANPTFTLSNNHRYVPFVEVGGNTAHTNHGQRAWDRTCPTGFCGLNAKDLPRPAKAVEKASCSFVAATDSGANIQATLAAARAGWTAYVDMIKSLGSEGWRWIFSDDPGNYIDTTNSAVAKAAIPAFGGASCLGHSFRIGTDYGTATGTFVHTNGANSVISDGLSNARKMVILHRESAGGGAFFCYHPECTAGNLLHLNAQGGEYADTSINTVTAGGFTASSALPSGTYRWLSIAEVDGLSRLFMSPANGSADGPMHMSGGQPGFMLIKARNFTDYYNIIDSTRSPSNPTTRTVVWEQVFAESAFAGTNTTDIDAAGLKIRNAGGAGYINTAGYDYLGLIVNEFTFRYANAR